MRRASAVIITILGFAHPARAALLLHHDLASLAIESETIVAVESIGGITLAPIYRVTRVLAGSGLRAGQTVTVSLDGYRMAAPSSEYAMEFDRTAIIFLRRVGGQWTLVPSGLRRFRSGQAYRFMQFSNPGPYFAVPQGRDPDDAAGMQTGEHWDRARLERGIAEAVARAERARAAIASRDRAAILALFPAPISDEGNNQYEDRVAHRAFEALAAAGDVEGALEVRARMRGSRPVLSRVPLPSEALLAQAELASAPLHLRTNALALLDIFDVDVGRADRLLALVRGNAPRPVRLGALAFVRGLSGVESIRPEWAATRARLVRGIADLARRALPRERDARVRYALVDVAWTWHQPVPSAHAIVLVARRERESIAWEIVTALPDTTIQRVAQLRPDGTPCEPDRPFTLSMPWAGGGLSPQSCPGATRVEVQARVGGRTRTVRARIE